MNIADRLYARVSEICGNVAPFAGSYLKSRLEAFERNEIGIVQFKLDMRIASTRLSEAHAELNAIRFPKFRERVAHAGLASALQHYGRAIPLMVQAVETDNPALLRRADGHIDAASRGADAYFSRVYRSRTEKVVG
ncbi:hypothetical protein [Cohnella lupini]|uniref:Uncharacterized protein n=1 Tax=Cohnella lupini TaxID=1294267 RepID=A0A3D9I6L6_9BACL|nr:hypothetical protein [Cohnella lupini]RED57169.1 hypothetical protein DFP95_11183 [Cohnella lupini]